MRYKRSHQRADPCVVSSARDLRRANPVLAPPLSSTARTRFRFSGAFVPVLVAMPETVHHVDVQDLDPGRGRSNGSQSCECIGWPPVREVTTGRRRPPWGPTRAGDPACCGCRPGLAPTPGERPGPRPAVRRSRLAGHLLVHGTWELVG